MMKKVSVLFFIVISAITGAQAQVKKQQKEKKGTLYFAFGSHRTFYSPSDITLQRRDNPAFDFTLYNVKAKDEGGVRFHTAPQFSYTVGYYFKKKGFGLEYHYDHIKYFMTQDQVVKMNGMINGKLYDKDTMLTKDFVQLEHSDGGNYAMVNVVKWFPVASDKKGNHTLDLIATGGFGLVNPKTNTTILGNHRDDKYHISGYVIGLETGLKYSFFKNFYLSGSFKGAYANYKQFLIANGYGHQRWFSAQVIYLLGAQFPL
jgi:hypothetical protein